MTAASSRSLLPAGMTILLGLTACWSGNAVDRSSIRAGLHLEITPAGADTRLSLLAAPGYRINARVKPALELPDGSVLRFDTPHVTSDSAYFAEPPAALLSGRPGRVGGTLRASVCEPGQQVCRVLTLEL